MNQPLKPLLRYVTNALSLFTLFGMISTGLVLKFILPPGGGRALGRGWGGSKPVATWLGQSRHEWGDWHFYVSIAFLLFMAVHLCLNWGSLRAAAWGTGQQPQSWQRRSLTLMILFLVFVALLIPFTIKPQTGL